MKTVQDLKAETEPIKKTQTEVKPEMSTLEKQAETSEVNLTNWVQHMRNSQALKNKIKQSKKINPGTKHPVNLWHCDKYKSKNNRERGRKQNPG